MEGATHYIEVWKTKGGKTNVHRPLPIEFMSRNLKCTYMVEGKTIAVWYIKPKQK